MMNDLLSQAIRFGVSQFSPELAAALFGNEAKFYGDSGDGPNRQRTAALEEVKKKDGSVSLWIGTRETGKCVSEDTPLCLSDGTIIRAGDCKVGDNIMAMMPDLKINTTVVQAVYHLGRQKCLEVRTRTGRHVITTPEHPYYTLQGWVPIAELKVGSRVAVARYIPVKPQGALSVSKIKLLAYLIGDGGLSTTTPKFTNADPLLVADFASCLNEFPDIRMRKAGKHDYCLSGKRGGRNAVINYLKEVGLWGKKSAHKFIPEVIFTLPLPELALFLNRLFSTDGWVEKKDICYCSISYKLISQIQHLLLRFGILSHVYTKDTPLPDGRPYRAWNLATRGKEHAEKFIRDIGIFGKEEQLTRLSIRLSLISSQGSWDTVPIEIWKTLQRRKNRWEEGFNFADFGRELGLAIPKKAINCLLYAPSRAKVAVLSRVTRREDLRQLSESDIYWDDIVSITETETEVCDLTTREHNFLAADMVVHNTIGAQRLAEFFERPVYAISPEQKPPSWITPVDIKDVEKKIPHHVTVIFEDLPAYMSSKDYQAKGVVEIERIIPMVRHIKKWHMIFNTQSSAQGDKYILDADLAFMKPWGLLMEDVERPALRKIYKNYVMPYFAGKSEDFIRKHAFMKSRTYVGGILIAKPAREKEMVLIAEQSASGVYEVSGQEEMDVKEEK